MNSSGFDIAALRIAVAKGNVQWQRHALERMLERQITRAAAIAVLMEGERVEDYPHDYLWPSALFLGWSADRPLHVVVTFNTLTNTAAIITTYEPTTEHFQEDFKTRRK